MDTEKSYVIIGAGKLAKSLCSGLYMKDYRLLKVISTSESSRKLAEKYQASFSNSITDIPEKADFIIISVKDDALKQVAVQIKDTKIPVFHTSGSIPADVFEGKFAHYGVLYPLQTFSDQIIPMKQIPLLIEANNDEVFKLLSDIAHNLSESVYPMKSEKRRWIHLAAVFACNFANHMQTIAGDILEDQQIPSEIIKPLIEETCRKIISGNSRLNQTGPAQRGDNGILESHSQMLDNYKDYQAIYNLISKHILQTYLTDNK
jgi:predicted short-subunit dehydrogenase-like oxidoreductase (DUF2520 family)